MGEAEKKQTPARKSSGKRSDLDFEIAFYERILAKLPDSVDILMALGNDYTERGLYAAGLAVDERLCRLRPEDPIVHYNLACSYCLVGDVDRAIETLTHAIDLGYHDSTYLQRDPDLESVRRDPRFLALVERVRRQHAAT